MLLVTVWRCRQDLRREAGGSADGSFREFFFLICLCLGVFFVVSLQETNESVCQALIIDIDRMDDRK